MSNHTDRYAKRSLPPLLGNRYLTFNTVVRCRQVEFSRSHFWGDDESAWHTPQTAEKFRSVIAKSWPGGRISWAMSWCALIDPRPNYRDLRTLLVEFHKTYGDDIIFVPGGFHACRYNSRDQINRDLHDSSEMISEMVGKGFRPPSTVALFLPAACLKFLAEKEGIHVSQGNCWSSHGVDMSDQEGSVAYPYYPSTEHSCKPAQGPDDFIDCVNLDGWTCDLLSARKTGWGPEFNSRLGVGPIETIFAHGREIGLKQMLFTTGVHFDRGFELNKFAWVVNLWEQGLFGGRGAEGLKDFDTMGEWLDGILQRWPDAHMPTMGEFGHIWRRHYRDNSFDYRFEQHGSGVGASESNLEIKWFMNKSFRLALVRDWTINGPEKVIDFTRYDLPAREPEDAGDKEAVRDWSIMNRINQKQTRPQDIPTALSNFAPEDRKLIARYYPELFA